MLKFFLFSGGLLGGLGVAAGSFGAHGLKALLDATGRGDNWETAVRYCLYHALAILVLAVASALPQLSQARGLLQAAVLFLIGWALVAASALTIKVPS
jgi:uncharacterized membrane protein YgdD (TMEM256/DUF423 family)